MRNVFKIKENKEQLRKCDLCYKKKKNPKSPVQETFNNRIFLIPVGIIQFQLKLHPE